MTERFLAYAGPLVCTELHSHQALQIVVSLDGPVHLRDGHGRVKHGSGAVIPRDVAHAIVAPSRQALVLHINPYTRLGQRLSSLPINDDARAWFFAGEPLSWFEISVPVDSSLSTLEALAQKTIRQLVGGATWARVDHPIIRRLLTSLPLQLNDDIRVRELARSVDLTPGQLQHLFAGVMGCALSHYILWLRLRRAASEIQAGASLTKAADAAGFCHRWHLIQTFRRMFGLSPTDITEILASKISEQMIAAEHEMNEVREMSYGPLALKA